MPNSGKINHPVTFSCVQFHRVFSSLYLLRAVSNRVGSKIRKLRDCAPMEGEFYPDEEPAKALAAISVALKPWSSASR